jgi:hypothetical protein
MHRELQPSGLASPFNHAGDTHAAKWLATLIDEYVPAGVPCSHLRLAEGLETLDFIAFQEVRTVVAALQAPQRNGSIH